MRVFSNDPFAPLFRLQNELDAALQRPAFAGLGVTRAGTLPLVNIFSQPEGYVVHLEVPGMQAADLRLEAHGRALSISGKRAVADVEGGSAHRRERWSGEFSRTIQLPEDVDPQAIEAGCTDGVLTVRVPRLAEARPRQIAIESD